MKVAALESLRASAVGSNDPTKHCPLAPLGLFLAMPASFDIASTMGCGSKVCACAGVEIASAPERDAAKAIGKVRRSISILLEWAFSSACIGISERARRVLHDTRFRERRCWAPAARNKNVILR